MLASRGAAGALTLTLAAACGAGGLALGPDAKLYFVDLLGNEVLRIDP